jgi:hypothetical protein
MTERDNDDHPFESTDELDDPEQWLRENVPPHHI